MGRKFPWYRHYPADFNDAVAAAGMTPEEIGAYILVLNCLYIEGGSIREDAAARLTRLPPRTWSRLRARLVQLRKIEARDGKIFQPRVTSELAEMEVRHSELSEAGSKGGKSSARRRSDPRQMDLLDEQNEDGTEPRSRPLVAVESPLSPDSTGVSGELNSESDRKNANKINDRDDFELNHARALEHNTTESDKVSDSPRALESVTRARALGKRGARREWPKGWTPPPPSELGGRAGERASYWPPGMAEDEAEKFQAWAQSRGERFSEWEKAWRTWILRTDEQWRARNERDERRQGRTSGWLDLGRQYRGVSN